MDLPARPLLLQCLCLLLDRLPSYLLLQKQRECRLLLLVLLLQQLLLLLVVVLVLVLLLLPVRSA